MINAPVSSSTTKRQGEREREREESRQDVKQQYPFEGFNIADECPTELIRDKDDQYLVNYSKLGFKQLDFVVAFPKKKDWFYIISQPNRCWTDEVNPYPLMF
ncbi:hypothetical protein H5410_035920 [Solanum commersonii]|uniref:Uncharacterized protein n=1 Tax=Solanum commersonii TaxID=4109 RepID=A0A9J5Y514_SOLCO|nr:hypothetical protein H5410_035920 [Solanum commersonii]